MSNVYEGRLLMKVTLRAVEWGKGCWIRSIAKCVGKFLAGCEWWDDYGVITVRSE